MRILPATKSRLGLGVVAALTLPALAACNHPANAKLRTEMLAADSPGRDHVYTIFLNSQNDPLGVTRFRELADFVTSCGFPNTRYHHFASGNEVAGEIRGILRNDRKARVCLVGWSGASLYAFDATKQLAPEGVIIDEIIYLDSNWVKEQRLAFEPHPLNVARVALLYSEHRTAPDNVPNAIAFTVPVEAHTDVATHPVTSEIVTREILRLGQTEPANGPRASP